MKTHRHSSDYIHHILWKPTNFRLHPPHPVKTQTQFRLYPPRPVKNHSHSSDYICHILWKPTDTVQTTSTTSCETTQTQFRQWCSSVLWNHRQFWLHPPYPVKTHRHSSDNNIHHVLSKHTDIVQTTSITFCENSDTVQTPMSTMFCEKAWTVQTTTTISCENKLTQFWHLYSVRSVKPPICVEVNLLCVDCKATHLCED